MRCGGWLDLKGYKGREGCNYVFADPLHSGPWFELLPTYVDPANWKVSTVGSTQSAHCAVIWTNRKSTRVGIRSLLTDPAPWDRNLYNYVGSAPNEKPAKLLLWGGPHINQVAKRNSPLIMTVAFGGYRSLALSLSLCNDDNTPPLSETSNRVKRS